MPRLTLVEPAPPHVLRREWRVLKRALDIVLGTCALALTLPLMVLSALAIVLCDRGPWLYVQERTGRGGRPFRMLKLRTMYEDAETRLSQHLSSNPMARREWNQLFKLRRDPRVIPGVGSFLRRWSLDECPQFWNVIKGDMSLVGPRALPAYHLAVLAPEARALREHVRPGVTGLWQVTARGRGGVETLEMLDAGYVKQWSIALDARILLRTLAVVVTGHGAR